MSGERRSWLVVLALALAAILTQSLAPEGRQHDATHRQDAGGVSDHLVAGGPRALRTLVVERAGTVWHYTRDTDAAWSGFVMALQTNAGDARVGPVRRELRLATHAATALRTFSAARIERSLPATPELRAFGLDQPLLRFRIESAASGHEAGAGSFAVGDRTPDGFGRYIYDEAEGNILILPDYQIENLVTLTSGES